MKASTSRTPRYLIVAVLAVPILGFGMKVGAQSTVSDELLESPQTTMAERLTQRQTSFNPQISFAARSKIVDNCVAAQATLNNWKVKDELSIEKRSKIYSSLEANLKDITEKLNKQALNSDELKEVGQKFTKSIKDYRSKAQIYKLALEDLLTISCKSDTTGFQATLLDARQLRAQLASKATEIKVLLPELAEALSAIKLKLVSATAPTGQGAH
ncbi:hypothetical protein H0X09_00515 [Candidatus Saccharibacteria bacterium]|nr:hypothetical protein [Candidatus Saccharibacteria bacterium]